MEMVIEYIVSRNWRIFTIYTINACVYIMGTELLPKVEHKTFGVQFIVRQTLYTNSLFPCAEARCVNVCVFGFETVESPDECQLEIT